MTWSWRWERWSLLQPCRRQGSQCRWLVQGRGGHYCLQPCKRQGSQCRPGRKSVLLLQARSGDTYCLLLSATRQLQRVACLTWDSQNAGAKIFYFIVQACPQSHTPGLLLPLLSKCISNSEACGRLPLAWVSANLLYIDGFNVWDPC